MEQYIPKSALVAEIEELIANGKEKCQQSKENNAPGSYIAWSEHIATCGKILSYINTLEVKEVDLEKETDKWYNTKASKEFENVFYEDIEECAKYFFELGLKSERRITMTPEEKFSKAVKLADAMYYAAQMLSTDASHLRKAMKDWWNFKNFELNNKE